MLLDLMRGLAAVLVLWQHLHDVFLVNDDVAGPLSRHPHCLQVFYALISAGNQAVVIFFVLSGYLIGGSVFRWFEAGQWSWRRYLTHRLVRLWVVLLPALVLCLFWDGLRLLRTNGTHALLLAWTLRLPANHLTFPLFLSNVFFLQTLHTVYFGSDRPLWSLAPELWYYLLFPLGYLLLRRRTATPVRLLYGVAFLAVGAFMGLPVLALFPSWLIGVALALLPVPQLPRAVRWLAVLLYVPLLFFLDTVNTRNRLINLGYVCAAATALFVWTLLSARSQVLETSPLLWISRRLAGCSYTLYLVHFPLIAYLAVFLLHGPRWQPDGKHLLCFAALSLLILLYAFAIASLTEAHNDSVRRWVERRLGAAAPE